MPDNNIFAVYKPIGPSSHQFIQHIKFKLRVNKIGHAGTLDPLAEGVLVVGINEGTKQLTNLLVKDKEYQAIIELGQISATDDAEGLYPVGEILPIRVNLGQINEALTKLTGVIQQTPPQYSAIKIKGQPAYQRTRAGEQLKLKPRPVVVNKIELLDFKTPLLTLRLVTGSGVYIRALARDLGLSLGTRAYLKSLVRTRVGSYTLDNCYPVADLSPLLNKPFINGTLHCR